MSDTVASSLIAAGDIDLTESEYSTRSLPILSSLNLLILLALTIFILPQTKAEGDGYRSIMYRIADK